MNKTIRHQIVLNTPEGIFPQTHEIFDSEEEAQATADRYNSQNSNPYCVWEVIRKEYHDEINQ